MNNKHKQFELVIALLLATTSTASSFVLSGDHCAAPPQCQCGGFDIYCDFKSLTDVPHFGSVTTNEYTSRLSINLNNNKIQYIPANVFQNVSSVNTSSIFLDLSYNMISSIAPLAFTGVEDKIENIQLSNNQLSSLPSAIGKLTRLEVLILEENPLVSIDTSGTNHLSTSLKGLNFDMGYFGSLGWPAGLSKLNQLVQLTIYSIPLKNLPLNAFTGLESELSSLSLWYSNLSRLPAAVCSLQNLQELIFNNNAALENNSSVFESCSHNLTKLSLLIMENNNLNSFPDVLRHFTYLTSMRLDFNKISYIPTSVIPYGSSLQYLSMGENLLTHIPFALNKLKQLKLLYLYRNQIATIEDNDLVGLTNLGVLSLQDNPIKYIAPVAFSHNVQITELDLIGTKLQRIPEAVRYLPRLDTFYFVDNVDCSCKMSYLKGWNVTGLGFYGMCADKQNQDPEGIKHVLLLNLTNCP